MSEWWVYIVETVAGKLYTGIATDVERRFTEHCSNRRLGAKFFRSDPAQKIVYRLRCADRAMASREEARIKKLSRAQKWLIIRSAASDTLRDVTTN